MMVSRRQFRLVLGGNGSVVPLAPFFIIIERFFVTAFTNIRLQHVLQFSILTFIVGHLFLTIELEAPVCHFHLHDRFKSFLSDLTRRKPLLLWSF